MKRKMGRRTKEEIAQDEAMGIKRMSADEELASRWARARHDPAVQDLE